MEQIKYITSVASEENREKIKRSLNEIDLDKNDFNFEIQFINEIPRHNLLTINFSERIPKSLIFKIGILIGITDKY